MCCEIQEYFCIGFYYKWINYIDNEFIKYLWCWGLGYEYAKIPIRQTQRLDPEVGGACYAGPCCVLWGKNAHMYHSSEKDVAIDVYTPCGYCGKGELYAGRRRYTVCLPCCKEEWDIENKKDDTVSAVASTSSANGKSKEKVVPLDEQMWNL